MVVLNFGRSVYITRIVKYVTSNCDECTRIVKYATSNCDECYTDCEV